MRTLAFVLGLLLLSALLSTSCGSAPAPAQAAAAAPSQPAPVVTPPAPADDRYTASGPIVVENQVDVAAQREGVVVKILVDVGTRVHQGQLLAKLDDRQVLADLEAARAKTASTEADLNNWKAEAKVLEADYQRARKMWDAKLITEEQFDHARYKAEGDQWDVKRVEELLINARDTEHSLELEFEKTQITAPFDGIVARRYIRDGQTVARDERLMWVTATGPLRVRFTLPSRFVNQVQVGQRLAVTVADGNPTLERSARVIQMSPVVDPASGTIEVLAELTGPVSELRPGMQAEVHLPAHP
ncbi:MAG TPA: efflux RND transporter periplasmic adaptor subunit [Candidatus Sulfotelmatobacter sp.]|nr:efflux RND transporter periplasmic adaptor subunit [Candidatus Sulfotelmatobacter sp.]